MKDKAYPILFVAVLLQSLVAVFLLENFAGDFPWGRLLAEDSRGYLLVTHFLNGTLDSLVLANDDVEWLQYRKFNPLVPLLVTGIHKLLPFFPIEEIYFGLNLLLYFLTALVFLKVAEKVLPEKENALAASLLFVTSLPVIVWELPVMLESCAFFLAALNLWIYLWFREREELRDFPFVRFLLPLAVFLALAILVKPTLLTFCLFWGFLLLWRRRFLKLLFLALAVVLFTFPVYILLSLTPADFLTFGERRHWGLIYFVNSFVFNYHFGLVFLFWGLWRMGREFLQRRARELQEVGNQLLMEIFFLHFIPSMLVFCYFVHNPRLLFLTYPFVLLLVLSTAQRQFGKRTFLFSITYCVASNFMAFCYLNITRVYGIRTLEDLSRFLGNW